MGLGVKSREYIKQDFWGYRFHCKLNIGEEYVGLFGLKSGHEPPFLSSERLVLRLDAMDDT